MRRFTRIASVSGFVALGAAALVPGSSLESIAAEQVANLPAETISEEALADMMAEFARPEAIPFPDENPYSGAKAELGKMLFFEPRMSGSNLLSRASCHNSSFAWEDVQPFPLDAQDRTDLVAFLMSLSGEDDPVDLPALPN